MLNKVIDRIIWVDLAAGCHWILEKFKFHDNSTVSSFEHHLNTTIRDVPSCRIFESWQTFTRYDRGVADNILHLLCISFTVYSRPEFGEPLMRGLQPETTMKDTDVFRSHLSCQTSNFKINFHSDIALKLELFSAPLPSSSSNLVRKSRMLDLKASGGTWRRLLPRFCLCWPTSWSCFVFLSECCSHWSIQMTHRSNSWTLKIQCYNVNVL